MFRFHTIIILIVVFPARTLYTSCSTLPGAASPFENPEISVNPPRYDNLLKTRDDDVPYEQKTCFYAARHRTGVAKRQNTFCNLKVTPDVEPNFYCTHCGPFSGLAYRVGAFFGGGGGLTSFFPSPSPKRLITRGKLPTPLSRLA